MYYIELAFGHNRPNGEVLPDNQITLAEQKVLRVFAHCFGGSQRYQALGSYQTADHQVVVEMCTVVRAYTREIEKHLDRLELLAAEVAHLLEQDCVLVTVAQVDGSLVWVEPRKLELLVSLS